MNPDRLPLVEQHVARRVAVERDRRDWSYERLAERVSEAGCRLHPSAIYKIEKGDPPRRITVDELVGFARAFDVSVTSLLSSADGWSQEMSDDVFALEELFRRRAAIRSELEEIDTRRRTKFGDLRERVLSDTDSRSAFQEWITTDYADWPEFLDWSGIAQLTASRRPRKK